MSASVPLTVWLPSEILERVLLHLPGQDIIRAQAVNRHLRNLIRHSSPLQCQCELFAAGLIDNPSNPCDFVERRKLLERYTRKRPHAATVMKNTHELPPNPASSWGKPMVLGRNMLASNPTPQSGIDFLYFPSTASRKPVSMWSIPPFPFEVLDFTAYLPENILAIAECENQALRIHLFCLRDGSPHSASPPNDIAWAGLRDGFMIKSEGFAVTGSRIMMCAFHWEMALLGNRVWTVLVWDQRTGELVLELSTTDWRELVDPKVVFLDEFRILVSTRDPDTNAPKLTVFDTFIPPGDSPNPRQPNPPPRRFGLPSRCCNGHALIHADQDGVLGVVNGDEPLIADPTQAILVVEIITLQLLLIVQTQTLMIEHACSTRPDLEVPWSEWGRNAVFMNTPRPSYESPICVYGTRLMVLETPPSQGFPDYSHVHTFDLGRRGRSALPLLDEGPERRAVFEEDGQMLTLDERGDVSWRGRMVFLGGGNLSRPAKRSHAPGSDFTFHVWELS